MASRFERVFLLENIVNDQTAPVELLAGAIINDVLTQDKSIQLKFQIKGTKAATEIVFDAIVYDIEGKEISRFPITYSGEMIQPGVPFGSDILIAIENNVATTMRVSLSSATFEGCTWKAGMGFVEAPWTVTLIRKYQAFVINPPIKVSVDSCASTDLVNAGQLNFELKRGEHIIRFSASFRETIIKVRVSGSGSITIGFNRITGKIDVTDAVGVSTEYIKHK